MVAGNFAFLFWTDMRWLRTGVDAVGKVAARTVTLGGLGETAGTGGTLSLYNC
jgi:hypothetical protein